MSICAHSKAAYLGTSLTFAKAMERTDSFGRLYF